MRSLVTSALGVALSLTLCACPPPPPKTGPKAPTKAAHQPPDKKAPAGAICQRSEQCASGICEGQGCGPQQNGACTKPKRMCTRDLRAYCGCDDKTFQSSGSCPGRRYEHRGMCKTPIKVSP